MGAKSYNLQQRAACRGPCADCVLVTSASVLGCVCVCPHPARTCQDLGASDSLAVVFSESAQSRYDMSAYILYQNQTIPEKWGGSLRILEV